MERSNIRVVVADSSKFHGEKVHSGWRVCAISKKNIDLVITDKAPNVKGLDFKDIGVPLVTYQ